MVPKLRGFHPRQLVPKSILSVLAFAMFVSFIGNGIINPLITIYSESLGASGIWLGIVFSVFALSRSVLTPFIGRFSDRHDRKVFLLFGLSAYTVVSVLYLIPSSVYGLTVVRILHGVSSAFIGPVVMAYGSEIAPEGKRASVLSVLTSARFFGFGLGPLIGGIIGTVFTIKAAFLVMTLLAVASLVALWILLPPRKPNLTAEVKRTSYRDLLKNRSLVSMAMFRMFMSFGNAFAVAFLPLFGEKLGMTILEMSIVITVTTISSSVLQFNAGKLADTTSKIGLIMTGSIFVAFALFMMSRATSFSGFLVAGLIMAGAQALTIPASAAIASSIGKHTGHGSAMGIWNFGLDIGVGIGPLTGGFLLEFLGFSHLFMTMGAIAMAGMFVSFAFYMSDPRRKEYESG